MKSKKLQTFNKKHYVYIIRFTTVILLPYVDTVILQYISQRLYLLKHHEAPKAGNVPKQQDVICSAEVSEWREPGNY